MVAVIVSIFTEIFSGGPNDIKMNMADVMAWYS